MSAENSKTPIDYDEFRQIAIDHGSGGPAALGAIRATARMLNKVNPGASQDLLELVGRAGVTGRRARTGASATAQPSI
jgi:hypothetical protein